MRTHLIYADILQEGQAGAESGDAGHIGRAAFKPVGQKLRLFQLCGQAAGAALNQGFAQTVGADDQDAGALRPEQSFVAGHANGGD